jgi:Asp/Glu/hydantoin racemase
MNKGNTILYLAHSQPGSYVYRQTAQYLERFPDVDIRGISETPHPFPKSVEEITILWLLKAMDIALDKEYLEAVGKAEKDGYGATACASAGDFSMAEAKEKYSIPYVGMGWASYWKAVEVGGRFTHLHTHMAELIMPVSLQQIKAYGFLENLVSVEYVDVDIYKYIVKEEEPDLEEFVEIFMPSVTKGVEKGARAITIGCGSPDFSELAHMLNTITMEKYNIPVLPPIDTVVNVAREFMEKRHNK